jgi:hypothetical protein
MTRTGGRQSTLRQRIALTLRRMALGLRRMAPGLRRMAPGLRQFGRRVAAVVAECSYAQRRIAALRISPDRYLPDPGGAPETYQEFLFRTSGPLVHELAAARRSAGRAVR